MESKKANKITEIVRLQQILKKWKKLAVTPKAAATNRKSIKFLKRTLSFSDSTSTSSSSSGSAVPRGHLAVSVGLEELRRYVIPTEYLGHGAFAALLKEAEEEFGFEQEGVLRIPCEVDVFESILKVVEKNKEAVCYCSAEADQTTELGNARLPPKPVCR